jgi:hypothetical protein
MVPLLADFVFGASYAYLRDLAAEKAAGLNYHEMLGTCLKLRQACEAERPPSIVTTRDTDILLVAGEEVQVGDRVYLREEDGITYAYKSVPGGVAHGVVQTPPDEDHQFRFRELADDDPQHHRRGQAVSEHDWNQVRSSIQDRLDGEKLTLPELKLCIQAFHADEARYDALVRSARRQS